MKPKTIALLVVLALFVIILIQNMGEVTIQILFWPIRMPKLILILASALLGWVIGWFSHLVFNRRKQKYEPAKKEVKAGKAVEPQQEVKAETQKNDQSTEA